MILHNGRIWTRDGFCEGQLVVENGKISGIRPADAPINGDAWDAHGAMIAPGFIDLHIHGFAGHASHDGVEAVCGMAKALPKCGVTGFLPTISALPVAVMEQGVRDITDAMSYDEGAHILGCHLEAPFLNKKRKGAQPEPYIIPPTIEAVQQLLAVPETVRHITIAPEVPGAREVALWLGEHYPHITLSCGHSDATVEEMAEAATWGFRHVTHLFNGMNPLHHRQPGVAGAALWMPEYTVEVIADHIHLHPAILALAARCKPEGCLVVTDSVMAAGLEDGEYWLGDRSVTVIQGRATLPGTDTLAGGTLPMNFGVRNMAREVPAHKAIAMASLYPAQRMGEMQRGHLDIGAWADIVVLDEDFAVKATMVAGKWAYNAKP